jgi:hypothetical protein
MTRGGGGDFVFGMVVVVVVVRCHVSLFGQRMNVTGTVLSSVQYSIYWEAVQPAAILYRTESCTVSRPVNNYWECYTVIRVTVYWFCAVQAIKTAKVPYSAVL